MKQARSIKAFIWMALLAFLVSCDQPIPDQSLVLSNSPAASETRASQLPATAMIPVATFKDEGVKFISPPYFYVSIIQKYYNPVRPEALEVDASKIMVELPGTNKNYYAQNYYHLSSVGFDQEAGRSVFMRLRLEESDGVLYLKTIGESEDFERTFKEVHWCETSQKCATCGGFSFDNGKFAGCAHCEDSETCIHHFMVYGLEGWDQAGE